MRVILVFGYKLLPSGNMGEEFRKRMEGALQLLERDTAALLVITGGRTRAGLPSEAAVAAREVPASEMWRVVLESKSKTISENVRFVRKLLKDARIDSLTIVSSRAHEPRIRLLTKRLWPEVADKVRFAGVPSSAAAWVMNMFSYILNLVDPHDRVFAPIIKKLARNG